MARKVRRTKRRPGKVRQQKAVGVGAAAASANVGTGAAAVGLLALSSYYAANRPWPGQRAELIASGLSPVGSLGMFPLESRVTFDIPRTMKVSDSPSVHVRIESPGLPPTGQGTKAALYSSGFKVSPDQEREQSGPDMRWYWTLSATSPGQNSFSVQFDRPTVSETEASRLLKQGLPLKDANQRVLVFDVTVVNDVGLTAKESAVISGVVVALASVGGLLALVKAIQGLARWRNRRRRNDERSAESVIILTDK
jgi:hypothetical protein